jgi:hypothetical protein
MLLDSCADVSLVPRIVVDSPDVVACLGAFWSGPEDFLAGKIEHPTEDNEGD